MIRCRTIPSSSRNFLPDQNSFRRGEAGHADGCGATHCSASGDGFSGHAPHDGSSIESIPRIERAPTLSSSSASGCAEDGPSGERSHARHVGASAGVSRFGLPAVTARWPRIGESPAAARASLLRRWVVEREAQHYPPPGPDQERRPVGREGQRRRGVEARGEVDHVDRRAALDLPEPHRAVGGCDRPQAPVRRGCQGGDLALEIQRVVTSRPRGAQRPASSGARANASWRASPPGSSCRAIRSAP